MLAGASPGDGDEAAPNRRRRNPYVTAAAWLVVAPLALWAAFRTGGWEREALVPLFAFTPYVAPLAVAVTVWVAALQRWVPAAVGGVAALVLVAAVVPRAVAGPRPPDPGGPTIRIVTANLYYGGADIDAVVALATRERADVVALQEVTPEALDALRAGGFFATFPHALSRPRPSAAGSVLAARFPLEPLPPLRETTLEQPTARLRVPGAPGVDVVCAHPVPPASRAGVRRWQRELAVLPAATPHGTLRLIAGDFNATLDHDALRDLVATGYVDAADAAGAGWESTWPVGRRLPGVTIDHVLADRRMRVERVEVHGIPGSDHRAVLAEITLPADR